MSSLNGIDEMLQFIEDCLENEDWDQLAALRPLPQRDLSGEDPGLLHDALSAVQALEAKVQQRLDAVTADLDSVPIVRKATRAYLGG